MKRKTIDANVYWLPQELFSDKTIRDEFIRSVPREYGVRAVAYKNDKGDRAIKIEKPFGCDNLNYFESDYTFEKQISDMDKGGIDRALLKLPGCQEWMSLELCRFYNDAAAKHAAASGGRMEALAAVPPFADDGCLEELERAIKKLGLKGIQLSAHYGIRYLDNEIFRDFLGKVNDMEIPVYVHHTPLPVDYSGIADYNNLRRSFGRCQDQITAIGRELFSGMFEELPNLRFIHSMLGGGYFAFKEMLMPHGSGGGRFETTGTENIRKWLDNNIYFEMSHSQPWGKELIKTAVSILGADKIIYGSSYPVKEEWMTSGADFVRNCGISEDDAQMILYKNAERIYMK